MPTIHLLHVLAIHVAILRDVHYKRHIQGHITEVFEQMQTENVKFKKYIQLILMCHG